MAEQNIQKIKIPPNGLILKLVPGDGQKNLQKITNAAGSSLGVDGSKHRITVFKNLKIYDDSTGNTFKLWSYYMPPGQMLSEDNQKLLEEKKYVDLNDNTDNHNGGRSSHKKYKKSSKRKHGRSMKRNVSSKSRKYSRRK